MMQLFGNSVAVNKQLLFKPSEHFILQQLILFLSQKTPLCLKVILFLLVLSHGPVA